MHPACRLQLNNARAASGRQPMTPAQEAAIEARLSGAMRQLARTDPNWRALTPDQRMLAGAQRAAQDIAAEAARKVANAQAQVLKTAELETRLQNQLSAQAMAGQKVERTAALVHDFEKTNAYIDGVKRDNVRGLMDLIAAADDRQGATVGRQALMILFDAQNPVMTRDLALEVFAKGNAGTGNAAARAGAMAWLKITDQMRQRFNAGGGDVGRLDYGYLPQAHDQLRVLKAGQDAWAQQVLPMLDRSRYLKEDGARMNDAEVLDLLRGAWETISSDGANKTAPGAFKGQGARANRGSESREIHFKDGEAYLQYLGQFGTGSMYDAMIGHIGGLSRDIGLVERYGPNPEAQMRVQFDVAQRADGDGALGGGVRVFGNKADAYWRLLNGTAGSPQSARIAVWIWPHMRNVETFGKLQGAVLSSITDLGTYFVTTGFNKLSYWDAFTNIGSALTRDTKDFMNAHGMIAESAISDLNRWAGENVAQSWSGRIAAATMRLSLMNAWTDTLRRGFQLTHMQGIGRMRATDWGSLAEYDQWRLSNAGLTPDDWAVIQRAQPVVHNGAEFVTPDGIYAVPDADVLAAVPGGADRIRLQIQAQTADLIARNAQDQQWIRGRIDRFDDARDAMNRWVKERAAKRDAKNQQATGPMLERMALLEAQREQAQLQADMEADFNRFVTQDEIRSFLNAVEDGASADRVDVAQAKPELRRGMESAEAIGRRYGVQKGRLERRMREIESRIAQMDRDAGRATDADAKEAKKKADGMAAELRDFVQRSQARQARRLAVVQRLQAEEAPRLAEEAQRVRQQVVAKYLGMISDESEVAVLNPDLATRAVTTAGGSQAGTIPGELWRAVTQFKSFPIAMISRHWMRMLETPQGLEGAPQVANRLAYSGALLVSLTALGAIAFQNKQIVSGKDPVDMTTPKFWTRAFAQGGGLGFAGDILLGDTTDARSPLDSFSRLLLGPTFGSAADLYELTKGNVDEAIAGKDTHLGAEALRFARSHAPFVNLWYSKAALDHAGLHALQESMSPGYLSRIRSKARKDWGQDYWWEPGTGMPDRAPSFADIAGN